MPTTVADADVQLHMDARPMVQEIQRKLGPIIDKVIKKNKLKPKIDEKFVGKESRKIHKILDRIRPLINVRINPDSTGFLSSLRGFIKSMGTKARLAIPITVEAGARNLLQDAREVLNRAGSNLRLAVPLSIEAGARNLAQDIARITKNFGRRARLLIPLNLEAGARDLGEGALSRLRRGFSQTGEVAAKFWRGLTKGAETALAVASGAGKALVTGLGESFKIVSTLAGPAVTAIAVVIGVKLIGVLITATALAAGLGAALVAAFAIAGSAAAVFGLAALPGILKIFKAVQGGNKEIAKLPKGLQIGAKAVVGLKNAFEAWTKPFDFFMGKMLAQWANLGTAILPKLTPIVNGMAMAFTFLGERAEKAINGPTFANFLTMLEQRGPRVFNNLTSAAGSFGAGLANVLRTVAPFAESLSGKIADIAQKFEDWTNSVQGQKDIREFFQWVKDNAPGLVEGIKDIGKTLLDLGKDLSSKDIAEDLGDIADAIKAIGDAIKGVKSLWGWLKENIGLPDLTPGVDEDELRKKSKGSKSQNALGSGSGSIDTAAIVGSAELAFREVGQIASDAWRDISVGASGLAEDVGAGLAPLGSKMSSATSTAVEQVQGLLSGGKSRWTGTVASATESAYWAWAPIAPRMGQVAWSASGQVSAGLWAGVGWAGSAANEMADRVASEASGISEGMFDRGAAVGSRLAAGIRSNIDIVADAAADMASAVAWNYPASPVKKGPLRILNHGRAGKNIAKMLAGGIESGAQPLGRSLTRAMSVPAGVAMGQRVSGSQGTTKTTTITKAPQFTVMSPSADPLAVAEAALRRGRLAGAF